MTDVLIVAELGAIGILYIWGTRRVRAWPLRRTLAFVAALTLLAVVLVALDGAAHRTLSVHMLQHMALIFVAAPLVAIGSPFALAVRATRARPLRSSLARRLAHPLVGWLGLSAALVLTHLPAVYDAADRHGSLHAVEHLAYLATALLFWRPVVGADPVPDRPGLVGRLLYLLAAAAPMGVVGVVMAQSQGAWYATYAGPGALADQRLAGTLMWVVGGIAMAILTVAIAWAALLREHRRQLAYEELIT